MTEQQGDSTTLEKLQPPKDYGRSCMHNIFYRFVFYYKWSCSIPLSIPNCHNIILYWGHPQTQCTQSEKGLANLASM